MAAESVLGSAIVTGAANGTGVALAGLLLTYDQSLAMGSIGGCCMFLAASASLPWSSRFFYAIGSFIVGYLSGILIFGLWSNIGLASIAACIVSALASWLVGSLKRWSDGGPKPEWLEWAGGIAGIFLPAFLKRGKRDE
ncbi:phage holin family protein [Pseudomonas sp. GD03842]|uniref:putative holin n=1 Tax=Pseudomonas sp. GD03842 TaxID=2975385 RepID=UPI0024485DCA|nr:putative holin [Pseudomonas sp. GD03842]MDH0749509.1 phage holin family protein [Pseudomonas sp. GD03842]